MGLANIPLDEAARAALPTRRDPFHPVQSHPLRLHVVTKLCSRWRLGHPDIPDQLEDLAGSRAGVQLALRQVLLAATLV